MTLGEVQKLIAEGKSLKPVSVFRCLFLTQNTLFLILYEMGMDDRSSTKETLVQRSGLKKDVRRIMGITQL